ncbi:hypothetical protein AAEX28_04485 [Lentisphaerota bacterium WC36G]
MSEKNLDHRTQSNKCLLGREEFAERMVTYLTNSKNGVYALNAQ